MAVTDGLQAFEADSKWIGDHYEALKKQYPDEWVAVKDQVVVEHGKDMPDVVDAVKKIFPESHQHIPIEFVSTEDIQLILGI